MKCQGHSVLPANGSKRVSIALPAGRELCRPRLSVHNVCGPCSACLADGNTIQRPPCYFQGRGQRHMCCLIPSGALPPRDPTTFLAPGAPSCEGPDSAMMHGAANSRASSTAPAEQERKPGSWPRLSVSMGQAPPVHQVVMPYLTEAGEAAFPSFS